MQAEKNILPYRVDVIHTGAKRTVISSPVTEKTIEVVTSPPFKGGIEGEWTSGHLFIGSLCTCLITNFLAVAENSNLAFVSLGCTGSAVLGRDEKRFAISEIVLTPTILIHSAKDKARVMRMFTMALEVCSVFNCLSVKVSLAPLVKVKDDIAEPEIESLLNIWS